MGWSSRIFLLAIVLLVAIAMGQGGDGPNGGGPRGMDPGGNGQLNDTQIRNMEERGGGEFEGRNGTEKLCPCADKANETEVEGSESSEEIDECSEEGLAKAKEEAHSESVGPWTIALGGTCLFLMFMVGYFLEHHHITFVPEAGMGILIGIIVGAFINATYGVKQARQQVQFNPDFFFIFLLPPIIFEAGYNMKRQAFFRNIGGVCLYAFLGTTISCFVVGFLLFCFGKWGWCHPLGLLPCLVFGALISATDPVTVLAVFQQLHADIDLYSLVFGESVLNDAVAIVLYRTLIVFKCGFTAGSIFPALGSCLLIFVGSTIIGLLMAAFSALVTKHTLLRTSSDYLFLEMCMLCIYPYVSFMIGDALGLSGIVAIMFCGIGMAHYTYNNLSAEVQALSRQFFKVCAQLAESFVFIYLGMAMFLFPQTWKQIPIILLAFIACLIARVFNVYPLSWVTNRFRKPGGKPAYIDQRFQFVIWFSGLRGAVAFVLAVTQFRENAFPDTPPGYTSSDSESILTVTLFIAVITVFTMGGPIGYFLNRFDLREKEGEEEQAAYSGTSRGLIGRGKSKALSAKGLLWYDRKYIKPILTLYRFDPNAPENAQDASPPSGASPASAELGAAGPSSTTTAPVLTTGHVRLDDDVEVNLK